MYGDMHRCRMSSSMMMAANFASSSSRRISFMAMITPVVEPPFGDGSSSTSLSGEGVIGVEDLFPARPRPGLRICGRACRTL
jgi:hypothetical protein